MPTSLLIEAAPMLIEAAAMLIEAAPCQYDDVLVNRSGADVNISGSLSI